MVEDILEKDSSDSYFIQVSDFVSYIVNLYYKYIVLKKELQKRIESWLEIEDILKMINILSNIFNKKASLSNEYGFVIYPQKKTLPCPHSRME